MSTREKREVAILAILAGGEAGVTSKTHYLALWGALLNLRSNVLSPMFPAFFVELSQTSSLVHICSTDF
jgi:hypothetical protein